MSCILISLIPPKLNIMKKEFLKLSFALSLVLFTNYSSVAQCATCGTANTNYCSQAFILATCSQTGSYYFHQYTRYVMEQNSGVPTSSPPGSVLCSISNADIQSNKMYLSVCKEYANVVTFGGSSHSGVLQGRGAPTFISKDNNDGPLVSMPVSCYIGAGSPSYYSYMGSIIENYAKVTDLVVAFPVNTTKTFSIEVPYYGIYQVWSLDDNYLGFGNSIDISSSNLTPGNHTLKMVAFSTCSNGASITQNTTLSVYDNCSPPNTGTVGNSGLSSFNYVSSGTTSITLNNPVATLISWSQVGGYGYNYYNNSSDGKSGSVYLAKGSSITLKYKSYVNNILQCESNSTFAASRGGGGWGSYFKESGTDGNNSQYIAFPNPATESVNVSIPKSDDAPQRIELMDMLGRIVLTQAVEESGVYSLNTEKLKGMYIVKVSNNNETLFTQRISVTCL